MSDKIIGILTLLYLLYLQFLVVACSFWDHSFCAFSVKCIPEYSIILINIYTLCCCFFIVPFACLFHGVKKNNIYFAILLFLNIF